MSIMNLLRTYPDAVWDGLLHACSLHRCPTNRLREHVGKSFSVLEIDDPKYVSEWVCSEQREYMLAEADLFSRRNLSFWKNL